jgi:GDP-4-dehydro-6-deoxy-D-mannose reductase
MRALVIGADGFAGRWLTSHLLASGDSVTAGVGPSFAGSQPPDADDVVGVDVRDVESLDAAVERARPDVTYYLAGVSRRGGREALGSAVGVSVIGSAQALASLARHAAGSRLLFVSSGYVYPSSPEPQDETAAPSPTETYGAAKLAAESALWPLAAAAGIRLAVARPFNHIGPGQAAGFLVPTVAGQMREIAGGSQQPMLTVGAIDEVRDFSDVRDVVRAYRLIAISDEEGTWNVASGVGRVIGDVIDLMLSLAGLDAKVVSNPPSNPVGPRELVGDPSRLRVLGWAPEYTLEQTLRAVLDETLTPSGQRLRAPSS